MLVGNAGVLATRVLYVKRSGRKTFVVVDAAMNDLVRPSYYGAHHEIEAAGPPRPDAREIVADVVGPICESSDFLAEAPPDARARGRATCSSSARPGAYGFAMSSNYNSRPRAAEVLVDGDRVHVARRRETWADLVRGERPLVRRGATAAPPRSAPRRQAPRHAPDRVASGPLLPR